jgi:hypothetical protein
MIGHMYDGTELEIYVFTPMVIVRVVGTEIALAEIGEQFAWLGAACQASPKDEMVYSTAQITSTRQNQHIDLSIDFLIHDLESDERGLKQNGSCWHSLFRNPVLVKGFPILARKHKEQGLEIPLNMMAGLGEATRATIFDGSLVIKGFSTIFVPTGRTENSVLWHLLHEQNQSRISYLCARDHSSNQVLVDSGDAVLLETTRNFVGWASSAVTQTG